MRGCCNWVLICWVLLYADLTLLQMLQWRRQNTGEIVSYAEAINSQVVKWAVLTHIDSLIQSVNTLLVWKGLQTKYCVMPVPLLWYFPPCLSQRNQTIVLLQPVFLDFFSEECQTLLPHMARTGFVHLDPLWQECEYCVEMVYPYRYTITDNILVVSCLNFGGCCVKEFLVKLWINVIHLIILVWQMKPSERTSSYSHSALQTYSFHDIQTPV